ncbi:MAG: hypothetical protein A3E83_01685 [Gammaproteobacteria bacterium RIFCSPHIGHO2_12_FULL_41_20]|nr:MAG: hypothetical protein A3E83_01685 [Gammaproteobacteria bacterium RIFCSPHIGHO2_12_FULL_41_20]
MEQYKVIRIPKETANDNVVKVLSIKEKGALVKENELIASIEGSKTVIDMLSEFAGRFFPLVEKNTELMVGDPIGIIAAESVSLTKLKDYAKAAIPEKKSTHDPMDESHTKANGVVFTKPALLVLDKYKIPAEVFSGKGLVTHNQVEEYYRGQTTMQLSALLQAIPLSPIAEAMHNNGRTLLIGAGNGAYQLLSVLLDEKHTTAIGILDDLAKNQGKSVLGVPVLGTVADLEKIVKQEKIDSIICAVGVSIAFRKKITEQTLQLGLRLANAIHPSVVADKNVVVGGGNFIGANSYIGPEVVIRHYCYISSGAIIEHHNKLGSGVMTGPVVVTSGWVSIGDHCKFGTGIFIEPEIVIEHDAVIASGSVITKSIAANTVVKSRVTV